MRYVPLFTCGQGFLSRRPTGRICVICVPSSRKRGRSCDTMLEVLFRATVMWLSNIISVHADVKGAFYRP